MIRLSLFGGEVQVGISEIVDGNMRFFEGTNDESEVIKNQCKLGEVVGLSGDNIARIRTIYDNRETFTTFYEVSSDNLQEYSILKPGRQLTVSDGLITKESNIGLLLPIADCLGLVVYDEKQKILGLLHAGRQDVEQGGPGKFIITFVEKFGSTAENLKIYFSPCALDYQIFKLGGQTMPEAAKTQLTKTGVLSENIIESKIDTVTNESFPSYSSGDANMRFAIIVKKS